VAVAPTGRLRRRDLQRLATHKRLFEAAIGEFQRVGFAKAQAAQIAANAGVAHGTFFFHFPTKDHVLL
jgi:AcrR family transcriptional regulator